jgi:hypothetical protein
LWKPTSPFFILVATELFHRPAGLFPAPLPRERLLQPLLFARLEVEGVLLNLLNDVFLLDFALEATQGTFQALIVLYEYFCQGESPPSGEMSQMPKVWRRNAEPTIS